MNKTLIEKNFEYIINQIRSYKFSPPLNYESCVEYVLKRLDKKIIEFDENKSSIKTFFNRYIGYYVFNYYRSNKQQPLITDPRILDEIVPDTYNLNSHINYEVSVDTDLNYHSPETDYWEDRRDYEIACEINELKTKQRNIILLFYYDNRSKAYIGRMFGVSRQAICQQIEKIEKLLKPKITKRLKELEEVRNEL